MTRCHDECRPVLFSLDGTDFEDSLLLYLNCKDRHFSIVDILKVGALDLSANKRLLKFGGLFLRSVLDQDFIFLYFLMTIRQLFDTAKMLFRYVETIP